jgi:bifunctional UDP-N-acetylglucosamine pyrophosphorylase/glucosamine-1-phosphate N-acetyltransferase
MRPLTENRPKVMLPLVNRPMLEHLLLESTAAGIREFIFVTGYHGETVEEYFGKGEKWGVSIEYCNQKRQSGTADALRQVKDLVKDGFLVLNGDSLASKEDIAAIAASKHDTMAIAEVENTAELGVVEVGGNKVFRIHEKTAKPPTNLINAGLYFFTPMIFEAIEKTKLSPRGEYELTDSLQVMIDVGYGLLYRQISRFKDIAYPWSLLEANEALLSSIEPLNEGNAEDGAIIKGKVVIGADTLVRSGSYIEGPVVIGKNCRIGPNCYIRPGTTIGDNCHIGAAVEVKNSIIMEGSKIPHHNYVGDSVIGANCNLGSGTKIANLRLYGGNVKVDGVDTGRRKFGAVLGDGVETGINSSVDTGTSIGGSSFVWPGAVAKGSLPPKSKVR